MFKSRGGLAAQLDSGTALGEEPPSLSIRLAAMADLACMSRCLPFESAARELARIRAALYGLLDGLDGMILRGSIQPRRSIRLTHREPVDACASRPLRLGIFPVKAAPFHWGHLLAGLAAMADAGLDKVVFLFVNAGNGGLISANALRLGAAYTFVKSFEPLFSCSFMSCLEDRSPAQGALEILELNPLSRIDAFYMAGCGHFRQLNPFTGDYEIVESLERTALSKAYARMSGGGEPHTVSLLLLRRDGEEDFPQTFLPRRLVKAPLPHASSRAITDALAGRGDPSALALLPFGIYRDLRDAMNLENAVWPNHNVPWKKSRSSHPASAGS